VAGLSLLLIACPIALYAILLAVGLSAQLVRMATGGRRCSRRMHRGAYRLTALIAVLAGHCIDRG
jgi:hypothetical protein